MNPAQDQDPLDRLNYHNGMRLEAPGMRAEQAYHIRVRRLLTQALHSPGVASGLHVEHGPKPHWVKVTRGVAIDHLGRAIVVVDDVALPVQGIPSTQPGWVFGNYLTVAYGEVRVAEAQDGCAIVCSGGDGSGEGCGGDCGCGSSGGCSSGGCGAPGCRPGSGCCETAWGGPTIVRAQPRLSWQDSWPSADSGHIVLAQVELGKDCAVKEIRTGVRMHSNPTRQQTRTFAFQGEANIDNVNDKTLYFHINGKPSAVTLYLRAERFSTLFYSELGLHNHAVALETGPGGESVDHKHEVLLDELETSEAGTHTHTVTANAEDADSDHNAIELDDDAVNINFTDKVAMVLSSGGEHSHTVAAGAVDTSEAGAGPPHTHAVAGSTQFTGQSMAARAGTAHGYVDDLRVFYDGNDITQLLVNKLGWNKLGDGSDAHLLAAAGTGPIRLDALGLDMSDGEHFITMKLADGGGGVIYNLYVD